LGVRGVAGVELLGKLERAQAVSGQLEVIGDVQLAGEHPVSLAAPVLRSWCLVAHGHDRTWLDRSTPEPDSPRLPGHMG
jgi:hypothetical protein